MASVHVIYASTSGHTEYVVTGLAEELRKAGHAVTLVCAEKAAPEDLTKGDLLVLASGTWNTGSVEGQLNPHMHELVWGRAKDVSLKGKKVAIVALGDQRYRYTAQASKHLHKFAHDHGATIVEPPLIVINEPYGQEQHAVSWLKHLPLS